MCYVLNVRLDFEDACSLANQMLLQHEDTIILIAARWTMLLGSFGWGLWHTFQLQSPTAVAILKWNMLVFWIWGCQSIVPLASSLSFAAVHACSFAPLPVLVLAMLITIKTNMDYV